VELQEQFRFAKWLSSQDSSGRNGLRVFSKVLAQLIAIFLV
jgi:hypothetical protein